MRAKEFIVEDHTFADTGNAWENGKKDAMNFRPKNVEKYHLRHKYRSHYSDGYNVGLKRRDRSINPETGKPYIKFGPNGPITPEQGVAEGSESLDYQGNCTEDDVVDDIFGDVNNFANMVEKYGDEFTRGNLVVKYDPKKDVHYFYYKKQGVAEGSGKNVVKSIKVGNFRHDLVDTGMGWQVRIYNGDELYDTGMSKNSEQKGLAALEDAVAYTEKQTRTKRQGVAEDQENFNGIDISMEIQKDDEYVDDEDYDNQVIYVTASSKGKELGHVLFAFDGEYLMPQDLEVEERYRGQGIAQTMYDYVKSKGYKIRRSGQQTDAGTGFWDKHRPGKNVWEQGVTEGTDPDEKYTIKKSYTMSKAGVEKAVWYIMDGDFVVDVTDLRRDAKYYADKWNAAEKESSNASQNLHKPDVAEGLTPNTIHKLADRKGIKWDDEPSFLKLTKRLTGKDHLDDLDQTQLQTVKQYLEKQEVAEGSNKKEATRRIQKMLNDKYKANLDVDGILGPLTLKSINKFIPNAKIGLADEPNKTTAVQGKKVKDQAVAENFADGKNPQDRGDSARHGIPKHATIAQLEKIRSSKTASPRKKQLAHWQINMRRGKAK